MINFVVTYRCRLALAVGLLALSSYAKAAPCAAASLSTYVALGATGCNIDTAQFTDFTILPAAFTALDPASVQITPLATPGFLVSLNASAAAGEALQSTFSFLASGPQFLSGEIALIGSSVAPDAANTALAIFSPGGTIIAFDIGIDAMLADSISLGGVSSLLSEIDLVVDGGTTGAASLDQARIGFSTAAIPEPSTAFLMLAALSGVALRTRIRRNR